MTVDQTARRTYASRTIAADPATIFAVLRDPSLHPVIDGSNSVRAARGPTNTLLEMGSTFSMNMKIGLPYIIRNTVVEYEQDRLIAWRHLGGHRWRWELEPVEGDDGSTVVTETFDWSTSRAPRYIELVGYPTRHEASISASLDRLAAFVEHRSESL